jgi:hypothetical protein
LEKPEKYIDKRHSKIISKLFEVGLRNYCIGILLYIRNIVFLKIFGYDKWHLSPKNFRPYLLDTIEYINSKYREQRAVIADVGCGCGDLLRSLRLPKESTLIGLDLSKEILKYATFLSTILLRKEICYFYGSLESDAIRGIKVDTLLMLNWTHSLDEAAFEQLITALLESSDVREIIIDTVPDYRNHDVVEITKGSFAVKSRLGPYLRGREILILEKV